MSAEDPQAGELSAQERETLAEDIRRRYYRRGIQTNETAFRATIESSLDVFATLLAAACTEAEQRGRQQEREAAAKDVESIDPVEWALAGQDAGQMAAGIVRGEHDERGGRGD